MANHINHQQAKKSIESAIARRQYNNSLEGALNNTIQNTLRQKGGFDTLEKDQESIAKRLQENAKKVEAGEYVDPKEYDSLIADSESIGKRLGYYRNYIRNASPDNAEAIKNATDMSKNFLDASKTMTDQQKLYSAFKDADDYKKQMAAYKEQQRLTFEYDLNAGKTKLDAAKGTKEYDALKEEYDLAKYYQTAHGYDKLTENEDFEKKSKKANSTWDYGETARAADFINGAWHAEAGQAVNKFVDGLIPFFNNDTTEDYERYKLMDESEVATFNYLYNTKGQKEAQKYLDFIDKYGLQSEYAQKNKTKNWLTNIMRAIDSGGERIVNGILNVDDAILHAGADLVNWKSAENYFGDKLIDSVQPSNSQLALSARRDEAGFWEGLTYDIAANAPQQLVNIGFSALLGTEAGGLAASITLGISEGTNAYAEALADGEDNLGRRLSYAVGMGVMEGVTNKLLDGTLKGSTATKLAEKLTSNISNAVAHTIVTYGAKGLSEGFEESLQEVLGTVLGNVTLDKNDEVWNWKQIGYSGLVGIMSANIMNSPAAAANLRLPENSAKSYHDTFDLADVKGVSLDTRFGVFAENYMKQDEVVSAKVISDITNGNTESAYKTINEAIKGYKYAKEYSKRELNQSGDTLSIFDDQIARLNTMKKLIGDGKFNAEAARNATMQNTSLWQIAAENNDTVAKTMLDDSLSNKKIEKNVLTDKGTMKAFYRLTGTDLSQFKTVTRKRNAVKVASDAYKAFATSDAAKQVTEILKANNSQTDATIRSENRINAQKVLEEAYKLAANEDKQARDKGDIESAKVAQAKMKLINKVKNDVRNGNALSFASLDGSAAVNNARKYAEKAPKVEPKYSSMAVARDFETAKGVVGDEYTELFEKSLDETNSFNEAEKTVLNDIDSRIKSAEGDEKTELIEQRKKIKEYLDLARAKNAEVLDLRKQLGREEFNKRANRFQKTLKQYGIDLEIENGGELYYDENENLISEEKYNELRKQGKKVSVVLQNGIHTERTIKIFDALSYGRHIRTLDFETGEIVLRRSGLDFNAREGVDFVVGHELVHEGETVNSGIVKTILDSIANTRLDSYYEIGKRRAGKKTSAEADKHWNDLKELYIKAETKNGDRAKAEAKVTDAYMYEEIAADYMGMLLAETGSFDAVASKGGLLTKIKTVMKSLISRLKGDKLDVRAERVKELMKKLDDIVKSNYGKQAKTAEDAQKSTQSEAKTEAEQTPTEQKKRAESDEKMMVVGENAETADQFDTNGWWQGKDGKWRYEIADNEMRFERDGLYKNPQTLEDYIEHDKLFDAYPHLRNVRVKFERIVGGDPKTKGQYDPVNNVITLKSGRSNDNTKRTLIHEIQHAVQEYEGFLNGFNNSGGYVEWFNRVFDKVKNTREYKTLKTPEERKAYVEEMAMLPGEVAIDEVARSLYRNNYGELEAKATAERLDMTEDQRRETPIVNDGNAYSLEEIYSKFVDNLRSMGYTDTQIRKEMDGEEANGRGKERESATKRNAKGKHIETDIEGDRSSRNINSRGEGKNQEHIYDGRVKYSLSTDSDGRPLTEAQQEFFKDSQIRVSEVDGWKNTITANGALFPVYHGTNSDEFFEFDKDAIGSANDYGWYGKGFYFAFTEGEASFYGDRVLECYLNVKKPFFFSEEMQSYDGQERGDVNYDFAAFVLNLSDKFPEIAQKTFMEVSNKGEYKDIIKKPFTEFAQEIKAIYESDEFKVVEVEDRGEPTYQYRYSRDIDSLEAPEKIKELIKEHYIDSAWVATWLEEKGTLTSEECDEILDLFEKYGEDQFSDRWVIGKFDSRDFAEKNRLSAVISYMRDYKYGYFGQHTPEYFMENYVGDSFAKELRKRGYDGVLQSRFGNEVVVFDSNQIKLTSNKNPTSNPDIRYSLSEETDTEYLSAVENGDMETAQRMVDEAAKAAGYNYHLYHGTNADFTKFDLRKYGGKNGKGEGYGIYLAANREISAPYGKNVIDSYTKFNRLAEGNKKTLSYAEVKKLIKKSCELEAQRAVDDGEYDSISDAIKDTWVSNYVYTYEYSNMSQVYAEVANILWENNDNDGEIINEMMASSGAHYDYDNALNFYNSILTPTTGIDGFHYIWGNKDGSGVQNDIYLAFSSEQIKSADPVTYDDNGNVIPLSERFNEKNEDIRYSVSEVIETEEPGYNELKRELDQLKARNERLAHEFVKTHGKEVDRRSAMKLLNDIIEKYQGTIKARDLLTEFEEAFAYVNTKGATVDALMKKLDKIATDIFNSAIEYDDTFKEYSELLTDLRTTGITVSEQDRGGDFDDVGGWNEFRKKNFGSIKFVNDGKVMIDSKYQELATKYPEWFDDSITHPAEQAKEIANVARKLREIGMTPKDVYDGVDGQIVVNGIVGDLYSALKDADKKVTFADKAEQKIADTHALDSMYYRRKISEIRKRNQERERQMSEAFHIRLHNLTQDRHKAYQEKVLRSRAKDLAKRAVHPTKTKHVPENMKGDVLKFLSKIPWASDNKGHTLYADEMRELVRNAPKVFTDPESEETDEINTFTKELLKDISSYSPPLDNKGRIKSVENMDADEIYEINEMLMRMIHEINTADKIFHSTAKASALATKAITQFNSNRKDREYAGSRLVEFIKYGAADPEAFFNVLNIPVLTEAYHNLAKRQDVFARTLRDLTNDMREITGGAIPKSWREDYGDGQTLASGQKVFLTPVQKMTLYLLSKQEASKKRLLSERGGIVPTDTKREFVWHTKENGKEKIKLSVPKTSLGKLAHLTQGDLDLIIGTLTEEQLKMADKISGLLNGKCADLGNEVSLAEEGYRKFIVENYFPMMVAETGRTYDELVTRAKDEIARKPFTKDRTGTAGVPLVIEDIFSVMDRHLLGMSQYYAYDEALRDFQRILRLRPEGQGSLELTMKGHFGNKGNKVNTFLSNFIKDVQGAQMQVGEETLLSEKFLSTYKAAQVAGNLSVVAKQPTAIFRAMPEFSAKGMAAMMNFATTKEDIKAMIENSGLAQLKNWGFSENTTAKSVAELYDKNATNWRGKLDDIFSWGAEKADMITWAAIWRASVADTKSLPEAIDKFNEVIRKTQVVKSAFTSSRIAEQSGFAKLAFAFKNEPLKTFNYIRSTINDVAEGKEGAKKKAFAVTVATAINTAVVAAISAGFSLIRDDEEDSKELFAEKFKENVIADLVSNSTIFLGDIWTAVESAMNGKDVERMDLAVFTDATQFALNFIDMFKKPESEQKNTWMKIFYDGARTVSNFTGIPIGNVIRALKSVHGRVVELSEDPVARYNMTKIWYNVEGVDNASIRAKFRSILTDALDEGNYKAFAEINNDLRRHGFSASDIEKAVSNSARLYDAWNKGAEAFRGEVNKAIKVAPMLSSTYVMEAFKSKKTALVNDLYDAMKSGSKKATSDARNALIKHRDVDTKRVLTESDVDKLITKKIESAIKSEVKSRLADLYGTESYDAVKKKILNEYRHFETITSDYIDKLARSLS